MPFTAGQTLRAADVSVTGATVATSETTASTTYTDLTTAGPAVTAVTGTAVEVTITCTVSSSTGNHSFMSFAVSGASTLAAADNRALSAAVASTVPIRYSATYLVTGLTAGSNTFTAKYRVGAGTGTFVDRNIHVRPA